MPARVSPPIISGPLPTLPVSSGRRHSRPHLASRSTSRDSRSPTPCMSSSMASSSCLSWRKGIAREPAGRGGHTGLFFLANLTYTITFGAHDSTILIESLALDILMPSAPTGADSQVLPAPPAPVSRQLRPMVVQRVKVARARKTGEPMLRVILVVDAAGTRSFAFRRSWVCFPWHGVTSADCCLVLRLLKGLCRRLVCCWACHSVTCWGSRQAT